MRGRLRRNREREEHEDEESGESYEKSGSESAQSNPAVRFHWRWRRIRWLECCAGTDENHRRPVGLRG